MIALACVVTPLVGALGIALARRRPALREGCAAAAALATFVLVAVTFAQVLDGRRPALSLFTVAPGIELGLAVDEAAMVFAVIASSLWIVTTSYAVGYLRGASERHHTRFLASVAVCISATLGLAFSADLFTFFVFYELLTLATFPLVVHKQSPAAFAAGRKYLGYLLAGGAALLVALVVVHLHAPGAPFAPGGVLAGAPSGAVVAVVVLGVLGFGSKAAVMPLHGWLPSAMVAPTPVSALLHAVAVVKAGVFGFVRLFGFVVGPERLADLGAGIVVATAALVTIVVASFVAFRQDNLKRRLAYSTIGHLSYIVLGLSLLSPTSWVGAMLHMANHAFAKITLFLCAGAIYVTTGVDRISRMDGIGVRMPVTMTAFTVASLGLAGVPPVGGFVSKWFLGTGAADAGAPLHAAVVVGGGVLTAGYLLPVVHRAFFRRSPEFTGRADAHPLMLVPIVVVAAAALAFGLGDVARFGELAGRVGDAVVGGSP